MDQLLSARPRPFAFVEFDVKDVEDKNYRVHRLLLGTHMSGGMPNCVQIAEVEISKAVKPNPHDYDEERGETGGYGKQGVVG